MWHAAIAVEGRPRVHPARALGLAVNYLITKPAFAKLPFGLWSRILVGQINRGHYLLALDRNKLVGFLGWALTKGDIWLAGRGEFSGQLGRHSPHQSHRLFTVVARLARSGG